MRLSRFLSTVFVVALILASCKKDRNEESGPGENFSSFKETASIDLGGTASAEISAYDPASRRLFVVNNEGATRVDVIDLSKYPMVTRVRSIDFSAVSGAANSVAVRNGVLAVALEGLNKQENGKVAILNAGTLAEVKQVTVGALPDMITFSPDGRYIVTANEGEPNDAYTVDPPGSVSVIDVANNYSVKTLDFAGFENAAASLAAGGFRVYGLNASLAKDVEPEYVTILPGSRKAWVTLQENNAIAEIDLVAGSIIRIVPLGVKDLTLSGNVFDVSDRDNRIQLGNWPVKAFYLPDAISGFSANGMDYLVLANEGDTRAYSGLNEEVRVKDINLDPVRFPDAGLKADDKLGRLTVTKYNGDIDGDNDFDEIYATGGRSFSILNAANGQLVIDIGKELEERVIEAGKYDDTRSDNKGVEVEGITVAQVNKQIIAFIGMERADMIAVCDLTNPLKPAFLQLFETGDAPEGILYIRATDSPNGRSLLVVCCEEDGTVRFYQPDELP